MLDKIVTTKRFGVEYTYATNKAHLFEYPLKICLYFHINMLNRHEMSLLLNKVMLQDSHFSSL